MARWMINCQEHARLASESMDRSLSFWDRLSVKIHQWICPACKQLIDQFDAIRIACRRQPSGSNGGPGHNDKDAVLPDKACLKMKSVLREQMK